MESYNLKFLTLLTTIFFLTTAAHIFAQNPKSSDAPLNNQQAKTVKNPELRQELLRRLNKAIAAREKLSGNGAILSPNDAADVMKTDRENAAWMKSEIEKRGWLGTSLVGEDGEKAAFRLALVSIHDAEFQNQCLELLKQAAGKGDAPAEQVERLAEMIGQAGGLPKMSSPAPHGSSAPIATVPVQTNDKTAESIKNPKLRDELLERMKKDQAVRMEAARHPAGQPLPQELVERFRAIDRENTAWMKKVVEQYGYPGFSTVGRDGEQAAFLIIQHADAEFQKQALNLIRRAVEQKEASPVSLAYLTDRILTVEGKPQIYGTQMRVNNGKPEPFPVEDEANVDKRRAEIGLPPLAEYVKSIKNRNRKPE